MGWRFLFIWLLNLFFANFLFAQQFTPQEIKDIQKTCEMKAKGTCDGRSLQLIKLQSSLCQVHSETYNCDRIRESAGDDSWRFKKCDEASLCVQNQYGAGDSFQACVIGLLELPRQLGAMTVSIAKETPVILKKYLNNVSDSIKAREEMFKHCDLECKKELARGNPLTRYLLEEKNKKALEKITPAYLWIKNNEYSAIRTQMMIHGHMTKEQYYKEIGWTPKEYITLTEYNPDQTLTLSATWKAVKSYIEKEYQEIQCYTPLEKQRLMCSVLADVVSGVAFEKALAKNAVKAVGTTAVRRTEGQLARRLADTNLSKAKIVEMFSQKNTTTTFQNQEWLNAISAPTARSKSVTIENSALKSMNDKIFKDEEFVTSLTNMYKEIQFDKFKALELEIQKKNPGFKFQYFSDYKSLRVAYEDIPGLSIDSEIKKLIEQSNKDFAKITVDQKIVREGDGPADWFKASIAKTDDMANLAARYARQNKDGSMFVDGINNPDFKKWAQQEFSEAQKLRTQVLDQFKGTQMVIGYGEDMNLHRDVIEILRKNKDNPAEAKALIEKKFGLQKISDQSMNQLSSYFNKADAFSPGLRNVQREYATLAGSDHGGVSIDMIGLGADHIQQTSAAAFGKAKNLDDFLEKARTGEQLLTGDVTSRKRQIESAFKEATGDSSAVVTCSGDGCKAYLKGREVSEAEARRLSDILTAKEGESGKLRFSQVSGLTKKADADLIAKQGEDIEKKIRTSAGAVIDMRRLEGVNFNVQIRAKESLDGTARVHISTAPGLKLSPQEREKIEEIIKKSVKESGYYFKSGN